MSTEQQIGGGTLTERLAVVPASEDSVGQDAVEDVWLLLRCLSKAPFEVGAQNGRGLLGLEGGRNRIVLHGGDW